MRKTWWWPLLLAVCVACQQKEIPHREPGPEEPDLPNVTGIATLVVNTDGGVAVDSKDPADYRPCSITVDWLYDQTHLENVRGQIRGRGNSTWYWYPKKPYRIKLDESASMLGLAENRDWVLLADYRDVTHMMNATGFYLAGAMGLPCANHIRYVHLTLNGKDMGLYALTEQVEEGGHRVPLDGKEGILLALDKNDGPYENPGGTDNFLSKVFGIESAVKYPEEVTKDVIKRVQKEFGKLEAAINYKDWDSIRQQLDVPSMVRYILIQEIIGNVEMDNQPGPRSCFIHRPRDAAQWVMGPLWDCDGGFSYNWGDMYDHHGRGHTFFENYHYLIFGTDPYNHKGAYGATPSDFFCRLFGIPAFVEQLQECWDQGHEQWEEGLLAYLDELEELIGEAAQEDMNLWGITNYSHAGQFSSLKVWLANRFSYLDGIIRNYPKQ